MRDDFINWTELELLTGLGYGEARGEPFMGIVAVMTVAKVRWQHPGHWAWGDNPRDVILKKRQFSCFDLHNPNRQKILENKIIRLPAWRECEMIAKAVYTDAIRDFMVDLPTHYHKDEGAIRPAWTEGKEMKSLFKIGKHIFYTCLKGER